MKKKIIPVVLGIFIFMGIISKCIGPSNKIILECHPFQSHTISNDSIELKVYIENSGSMDAYMCPGSNLKDAVYDYVSDLNRFVTSCSLNYINSKIIPYPNNLNSFIKDLTPISFRNAGGNRKSTNLMQILDTIIKEQTDNTVSLFISDCILDIPQNALDFLGTCQVSIKNTFSDAITKNPLLGVEIIKLESKFDGYWYCGNNKEELNAAKRPYYMWIIGDQRHLARLNKEVPIQNIMGGIQEYCAYATSQTIPFNLEKRTFIINHTGKINVNLLVDLSGSLQQKGVINEVSNFKSTNPNQVSIRSVKEISDKRSRYSHVIELEIDNPATLRNETITFSYPQIPVWVSLSNDTTGINVKENLDKTTGLIALIKGVAEAYKNSTAYGSVSFELKNK